MEYLLKLKENMSASVDELNTNALKDNAAMTALDQNIHLNKILTRSINRRNAVQDVLARLRVFRPILLFDHVVCR